MNLKLVLTRTLGASLWSERDNSECRLIFWTAHFPKTEPKNGQWFIGYHPGAIRDGTSMGFHGSAEEGPRATGDYGASRETLDTGPHKRHGWAEGCCPVFFWSVEGVQQLGIFLIQFFCFSNVECPPSQTLAAAAMFWTRLEGLQGLAFGTASQVRGEVPALGILQAKKRDKTFFQRTTFNGVLTKKRGVGTQSDMFVLYTFQVTRWNAMFLQWTVDFFVNFGDQRARRSLIEEIREYHSEELSSAKWMKKDSSVCSVFFSFLPCFKDIFLKCNWCWSWHEKWSDHLRTRCASCCPWPRTSSQRSVRVGGKGKLMHGCDCCKLWTW